MGLKFNFDEIRKRTEDAAKGAADVVSGAAKTAAGAVSGVTGATVTAASGAASNVADVATKIASNLADTASSAHDAAIQTDAGKAVSRTAGAVSEKVAEAGVVIEAGVNNIKENTPSARRKRARMDGFKDGISQGAYLREEQRFKFYYAYTATLCYFLRCDGDFSKEEQQWLEQSISFMKLENGLSEEAEKKIQTIIENESIDFEEVKTFLSDVSVTSLDSIAERLELAIDADGELVEEEMHARRLYFDYIASRATRFSSLNEEEINDTIKKSLKEYSENYDRINTQFKEATKLQDSDVAFLAAATALQVLRVLIINSLTEIERAGQGNIREQKLHESQNNLFKNWDSSGDPASSRLHASKNQILTGRGVPYDATRYEDEKFSLFKGANHRFATLGHDPLLGLVFGTSNIMTNSISCVKSTNVLGLGLKVPVTHLINYDITGKNPKIAERVPTTEMLASAARRVVDEPEAAAAALIKQLIHIETDLFTPCGIQIPFANVVLDKAHVEKLTKYVGTGDVLKVGVQAGMTVLINWLIATLHGSKWVFKDDGADFSSELHQVRTKKIILISNTIATSSSIVQAVITKNPKCLDIGGAGVLVYRLFTDVKFITKLKEEYVNSELSKIYEERAKGLL